MQSFIDATVPRLPVLGWQAFSGPHASPLPGVTAHADPIHTTSGRAAILAALRALAIGPGSGVLVPTYHCPTMIAPAVMLGAEPVFYPITDTGAPDLHWLERQDCRPIRALLAAHFFGLPQPMRALRAFCDTRGIALIEDCAHAFFGISDGRPVGGWGDFAIASLTKFFPVNEGGLLIARQPSGDTWRPRPRRWIDELRTLIDALETGAHFDRLGGANRTLNALFAVKRRLRAHTAAGDDNDTPQPLRDAELIGQPKRITRMAQLIYRCTHQARIVARRRHHYRQLVAMLSGRAGVAPLMPDLPTHAAPYVMPLRVDAPEQAYRRLRESGVPVFRWCRLWPDTPDLAGDAGRRWSTEVFQLGCHQDLSPEDIAHIADTVKKVCA